MHAALQHRQPLRNHGRAPTCSARRVFSVRFTPDALRSVLRADHHAPLRHSPLLPRRVVRLFSRVVSCRVVSCRVVSCRVVRRTPVGWPICFAPLFGSAAPAAPAAVPIEPAAALSILPDPLLMSLRFAGTPLVVAAIRRSSEVPSVFFSVGWFGFGYPHLHRDSPTSAPGLARICARDSPASAHGRGGPLRRRKAFFPSRRAKANGRAAPLRL